MGGNICPNITQNSLPRLSRVESLKPVILMERMDMAKSSSRISGVRVAFSSTILPLPSIRRLGLKILS